MSLDKEALLRFIQDDIQISEIIVHNKKFYVDSSDVAYSDVPVSKPTTRGGVYF